MRLALLHAAGLNRIGAIVPGGAVLLDDKVGFGIDSLSALLVDPDALARAALLSRAPPDVAEAALAFRPFLPGPHTQIFCAGLNYQSHADEKGRATPKPNAGFFVKLPSTLRAHGETLVLPRVSEQFDFEGELCVVIGHPARHVTESEAMAHVGGYTVLMDGSVRDFQKNSVGAGKNFEHSSAAGPWMVTADEVPDPAGLSVITRLNGEVVQQAGVDQLIHTIPRMIAYLSGITTLAPGDLIATGTPEGSGQHRTPPRWLRDGDRLEIDIPGVAVLANTIAAERTIR